MQSMNLYDNTRTEEGWVMVVEYVNIWGKVAFQSESRLVVPMNIMVQT